MLITEQVILALFSIMGAGLLLALDPLRRASAERPTAWLWMYGVGSFSLCWALFAATPWLHPAIFIVVTICGFGSAACSALFFRSTYRKISRRTQILTMSSVVILAIAAESLQLLDALDVRLVYITTVVGLLTLWQALELSQSVLKSPPHLQKLLLANLAITVLILILALARFVWHLSAESAGPATLFDQNFNAQAIRWMVTMLIVIRYFLMATYLLTQEREIHSQALNTELAQRSSLFSDSQDKAQLRQLLAERDQLIQALVDAKTNGAETGALSIDLIQELKHLFASIERNRDSLQTQYNATPHQLPDWQSLLMVMQSANQQATDIISSLEGIVLQTNTTPERVNLAAYIQALEPVFLRMIRSKGISMDIQHDQTVPCEVTIQPAEFQQAIVSLFKRAVTAHDTSTCPNKRISIEITSTQVVAQIYFMDNGKGLGSAFANDVHGWLDSIKETDADICVSEYLIEKMQGHLLLDIKQGWSTTFKIELPLAS